MAFIFFGLTQCYKKLYSAQPENDDIGNNFTGFITGFINVTMIDSGVSKSQSCCGDTTAIQAFAQSKSQFRKIVLFQKMSMWRLASEAFFVLWLKYLIMYEGLLSLSSGYIGDSTDHFCLFVAGIFKSNLLLRHKQVSMPTEEKRICSCC
ncbi:MAG TPA: hypothetical protein PK034_04995 [Rugosibacter sp.]|nr:hypothetical protein [Rugosibacter sp.]